MSITSRDQDHKDRIDYNFTNLKKYIEMTEGFLSGLEKIRSKPVTVTINGETHEGYTHEYTNVIEMNVYPSTYRSSLLITICSTLESNLLEICKDVQHERYLQQELDTRNGMLGAVKNYFIRTSGLSFPNLDPVWNKMHEINSIRNCVVHNNGKIWDEVTNRGKHRTLMNACTSFNSITHKKIDVINELIEESHEGLKITSPINKFTPEYVFFKKTFCGEVIGIYEDFFDKLFKCN